MVMVILTFLFVIALREPLLTMATGQGCSGGGLLTVIWIGLFVALCLIMFRGLKMPPRPSGV